MNGLSDCTDSLLFFLKKDISTYQLEEDEFHHFYVMIY